MIKTKTNFVLHLLIVNYLFSIYQYLTGGRIYLFRIGGINILNEDIVSFFIILALIKYVCVNHGMVSWPRSVSKWVLIFSGVAIIGLSSALMSYGLSSTVLTNMRTFLEHLILPVLYFSIVPIRVSPSFKKEIRFAAIVVMLTLTVLWVLDIGLGVRPFGIQTRTDHLRVIGPHQALLFAMYALYELCNDDSNEFSLFGIILSLYVVLMQYRTVWMAFFAGFVVICYKRLIRDNLLRNKKAIIQIATLAVAVLLFAFNSSGVITDSIMDNMDSFSDLESGTFGFRMDYWKTILSGMSTRNWIIGMSMGQGYPLGINPHSFIIKTLAKTGWIGLMSIEIFLLSLFRKSLQYSDFFAAAMVTSIIAFGISYDYNMEAGMVMGVCCYILKERSCYIET